MVFFLMCYSFDIMLLINAFIFFLSSLVGRPIPLKLNPHPSKEEIDRVHRQYMDLLTALFNEYKVRFGLSEDEQLEII